MRVPPKILLLICGVLLTRAESFAATVTLHEKTIDELFPGGYLTVTGVEQSEFYVEGFYFDVYSQSLTDGMGSYCYLYQLYNVGQEDDEALGDFTIEAFNGLGDPPDIGYLSGDMPAGFAPGGLAPDADADLVLEGLFPDLTFHFTVNEIGYGQFSGTLYGLTDMPPPPPTSMYPRAKTKSSSSQKTATGKAVAPSPEPATLLLLGLGAAMLRRRR